MSETTYPTPAYTMSTATAPPEPDPLAMLPDDERRLVTAWRRAQEECKNGKPFLGVGLYEGKMIFWSGHGSGLLDMRQVLAFK